MKNAALGLFLAGLAFLVAGVILESRRRRSTGSAWSFPRWAFLGLVGSLPLILMAVSLLVADSAVAGSRARATSHSWSQPNMSELPKSDAEWREKLTAEQFQVLRKKGTERAFSGAYWDTKDPGVYRCAGCGEVLFDSSSKFDSGCGWPSFSSPFDPSKVEEHVDKTYGMVRTEVTCKKCGGHLGHVFNDGPKPTGQRYCINSASISLEPAKP